MIEEKSLNDALRAMVLEYGVDKVERALVQIRKGPMGRRGHDGRSAGPSSQKPKLDTEKQKKAKVTARGYVSKLEVDREVRVPLEEVASQYESKSFLPTVGEIRNFCAIHGIEVPASLSRAAAIPRIFKHLSQLAPQEIRSVLQSSAFSGPTRLAPIADAIRRSSEQRASESTVDRGTRGALSDTMETKEKDLSKPPIPKGI